MKCVNCDNDAVFTVTNPATRDVNYCTYCLPPHLRMRASQGHFPLQGVEEVVADTPVKRTRKKA